MSAALPGTRLLAFASRWFEPAVVASVFEPLVADWQREWQEAARTRRPIVRGRGAAAFVLAALCLVPRLALAPLPAPLSWRLIRHVLLYCTIGVVVQGAFAHVNWRWAALPPSAWLFLMPALFTTLLPFAMVAGVDAIRCHESWPDQLQRRAAFKLVAVVTLWIVIGGGWVVPKMNQRWQNAVDSANAGQAVAPLIRVGGLSTYELLTVGDHASRSTFLIFPGERRRELENRVSFALLPVLLLWIRWRLLDVGSTGWFVPPPLSVIGAMATTGVIVLRALRGPLGSAASPRQYVGIWITLLLFSAAAVVGRKAGHRPTGEVNAQ